MFRGCPLLRFALPMAMLLFDASASSTAAPRPAPPSQGKGSAHKSQPVRLKAKLEIHPSHIVLDGPSACSGVLATLLLPDGSRKDVTSLVRLSATAPAIAGVQ